MIVRPSSAAPVENTEASAPLAKQCGKGGGLDLRRRPAQSRAMAELAFLIADVFTAEPFAGNPLAIFPDCQPGMSTVLMQHIARELNLSESIFVFPPEDLRHTRRVRIFTPAREMPFAGHPTVGCSIMLAERGLLGEFSSHLEIVLEENVGPVPVKIERRAGGLFATLTAAKLPQTVGTPPAAAAVAEMLSLASDDLAPTAPVIYTAGLPFLIVAVRDLGALARARLDVALWARLLAGSPAQEIFVVTMADWRTGREIRARMFAPAAGIAEDPATGSAAAATGGWLMELQRLADGDGLWVIHQGVEMGRPSRIELGLTIRGGALVVVRVGGTAVAISEGHMLVA